MMFNEAFNPSCINGVCSMQDLSYLTIGVPLHADNGGKRYEGYCFDLIGGLNARLAGFNYTIYLSMCTRRRCSLNSAT